MIENAYTYATQPHAAPNSRKQKTPFREEESPANLMHDPRVVRGSTYSANVTAPPQPPSGPLPVSKNGSTNNLYSKTKRRGTKKTLLRDAENYKQEDVLEELTDRAIEMDAETHTTAILERPPSPVFVRAKIGKDVETQIENGDLFDFDVEVTPLLEVLVGKTLHVSMLELIQEEELEAIRIQQVEFEAIRNTELAEVQRYENEGRRLQKERERRAEQEEKRKLEKEQLKEKIAARSFAQQYLTSLHEGLFDTLEEQGFFFDPVEKEIEESYVGPLLQDIVGMSNNNEAAKTMADELLELAMAKMIEMQESASLKRDQEAIEMEKERAIALAQRQQEEAAAKKAAEAAAAADEGGEAPAADD